MLATIISLTQRCTFFLNTLKPKMMAFYSLCQPDGSQDSHQDLHMHVLDILGGMTAIP